MSRKLVIGITGASGAMYAKLLLESLAAMGDKVERCGIIMSDPARKVWQHEIGTAFDHRPFDLYDKNDFGAPFASGSANYDTMVICPCSMGTLGRIAHGLANDLMTRAADVMLKERRKLILVARETPLSLIHINNMKLVTEAGGIICPAVPSFYSKPASVEELAGTVVSRVLQLAGLGGSHYVWGDTES